MATNYTQEGKVIQYTAAADIASGAVVWVGGVPGIALTAIANGATGSVAIEGVFAIPKHNNATPANGTAFAVGDPVFWDGSKGVATAVLPRIGYCTESAGGSVTTVNVKLDGKRDLIPVIAGEAIDAGELVYVSGWDAKGYLEVSLADADAAAPANAAIAVAIANIDNAAIGHVGDAFLLTGQDTDAADVGDAVYLSDTAGGWTKDAHTTGGDTVQQVGVVTVKHASTGAVLLAPGLFKATTVNTTE